MGIDLRAGGRRTGHKVRKDLKSKDPYRAMLVRLYQYLSRRTEEKFNERIASRLLKSRSNRPPMSLSKIAKIVEKNKEGKIAVVVGSVTNDSRMLEVPKMTVCAMRFTETARGRIIKAGGECLSFDQLALREPKGENCLLLRYVFFSIRMSMCLTFP